MISRASAWLSGGMMVGMRRASIVYLIRVTARSADGAQSTALTTVSLR